MTWNTGICPNCRQPLEVDSHEIRDGLGYIVRRIVVSGCTCPVDCCTFCAHPVVDEHCDNIDCWAYSLIIPLPVQRPRGESVEAAALSDRRRAAATIPDIIRVPAGTTSITRNGTTMLLVPSGEAPSNRRRPGPPRHAASPRRRT